MLTHLIILPMLAVLLQLAVLHMHTVPNIAITQKLFQCMASVDKIEISNQVGEL